MPSSLHMCFVFFLVVTSLPRRRWAPWAYHSCPPTCVWYREAQFVVDGLWCPCSPGRTSRWACPTRGGGNGPVRMTEHTLTLHVLLLGHLITVLFVFLSVFPPPSPPHTPPPGQGLSDHQISNASYSKIEMALLEPVNLPEP